MRFFELTNVLLLAGCLSSVAAEAHEHHRVLRAATTRSKLLRRDTKIERRFETEVVYIEEENAWNGRETFATSVKVGSKKPILSLEDIEHHLQDVQCGDGKMMLNFIDASSARDARAACHGGHGGMGGLVISSHASCNRDGERAVYRIDEVSYANEGMTLDLAVSEALWQDAFDNLDINFGHTRYDHIYRRHSDFSRARAKRQDELKVVMPPETPDNVTDVKFDLTSELLNKTFTAADFLTGLESFIPVPGVAVPDLPIEVGCKNCSTRGQIILTQGAIKIDTKQIDLVPDIFEGGDDGKEITNVITGGYMELAVKGVGARLEMFARPISSGSYEIALFPLPVLGFVIPGIGKAGASFEPKISVDFELDGQIAVNYGIDVAIPDNAGIKVELGDLTNTTITGLKGATLNALPFTSNVTDVDLSLSLAFTPTIPIGFEFSDKLSALVTVSLNLPRLDAKLTTKVGKQCVLLDTGNKTMTDSKPQPKPKNPGLSSLVLVEANISVAIDVSADLTLPLLPAPFDSAGTSAQIFSTEMPLMTTCVTPMNGKLKITEMPPMATLTADKADVKAGGEAACTKHDSDGKCTCATATTTVYAAPPTGEPPLTSAGYSGEPPKETLPPLEMTPYYPGAPPYPSGPPAGGYGNGTGTQPPGTATSCASTQTLPITMTTSPPTTDVPAPPPIIIISAPKPCNSTTSSPTVSTSTASGDGYFHPSSPPTSTPTTESTMKSSAESNTESKTQESQTQTTTTTTPPKIEESKGFMAPSSGSVTGTGTGTGTGGTANSTHPPQFTGAAAPGISMPVLGWSGIGWQIGVVGVGIVVGGLVV